MVFSVMCLPRLPRSPPFPFQQGEISLPVQIRAGAAHANHVVGTENTPLSPPLFLPNLAHESSRSCRDATFRWYAGNQKTLEIFDD